MAFDSDEAKAVNKLIFETIYHGALTRSCKLSKDREAIILKYKSKNPSYLKKKIKNILALKRRDRVYKIDSSLAVWAILIR
jgi:ribonucleotide reductase alpha subunit